MELFTYATLKSKLQTDCDITDERFISESELLGYINDAIDDAETAIHTMHYEQKYFLTSATITFVSGTQDYAMPTNIYGNKIMRFFYINGADKYRINRIKNTNLDDLLLSSSADSLRYMIVNDEVTGAPRIRMVPTPTVSGAYGTLYYIRNMKRMTTSALAANVCEVPECINYVTRHVKRSVAEKTRRAEVIAAAQNFLDEAYEKMLEALKDMTVEEDNQIPMDLSSYRDQGDC